MHCSSSGGEVGGWQLLFVSQREIYAPRSAAIFVSPKQFNQLELLHNLSVSALERVHLFFLGGPVGTGDLGTWGGRSEVQEWGTWNFYSLDIIGNLRHYYWAFWWVCNSKRRLRRRRISRCSPLLSIKERALLLVVGKRQRMSTLVNVALPLKTNGPPETIPSDPQLPPPLLLLLLLRVSKCFASPRAFLLGNPLTNLLEGEAKN